MTRDEFHGDIKSEDKSVCYHMELRACSGSPKLFHSSGIVRYVTLVLSIPKDCASNRWSKCLSDGIQCLHSVFVQVSKTLLNHSANTSDIICNTLQSPIYFTSGQKFTPSTIIPCQSSSLSNTPARSNSE